MAVGVQEERVHDPGVGNDRDRRIVLRLASLDAPDRNLVAPARAVVRRDRQRDVGRGAVRLAWSRLPIAGGEDIDVGIVRIGRHRRLPVVDVGVHDLLSCPTRGRVVRGGLPPMSEGAGRPGLGERVQAGGGGRVLLGAAPLPAVAASGIAIPGLVRRGSVQGGRRTCVRGTSRSHEGERKQQSEPAPMHVGGLLLTGGKRPYPPLSAPVKVRQTARRYSRTAIGANTTRIPMHHASECST